MRDQQNGIRLAIAVRMINPRFRTGAVPGGGPMREDGCRRRDARASHPQCPAPAQLKRGRGGLNHHSVFGAYGELLGGG